MFARQATAASNSPRGATLSCRTNQRTPDGFYEEDVHWAFVALRFPELFPTTGLDPRRPETTTRDFALGLAGHFYPDLVARFLADEADKQGPPFCAASQTDP